MVEIKFEIDKEAGTFRHNYYCDMCKKKHSSMDEAEKCQDYHEERGDLAYNSYIDTMEIERQSKELAEAEVQQRLV